MSGAPSEFFRIELGARDGIDPADPISNRGLDRPVSSAVHHEKLQRFRGTHTVERNPKLRLTQLEVVEVVDASSRADSALRRVGPAEIRQLRSAIS